MTKGKRRRNISARRTMQVEHLSAWTSLTCDAILEMALQLVVQPPPDGPMSLVESSLRCVVSARMDEVARIILAWVQMSGRSLRPPDRPDDGADSPIWDNRFIKGLFEPQFEHVRWVGDELVARVGFTLVIGSICCGELARHSCVADVWLLSIEDVDADRGWFEVAPGTFRVSSTVVLPVAHLGTEPHPLEIALDCCDAW